MICWYVESNPRVFAHSGVFGRTPVSVVQGRSSLAINSLSALVSNSWRKLRWSWVNILHPSLAGYLCLEHLSNLSWISSELFWEGKVLLASSWRWVGDNEGLKIRLSKPVCLETCLPLKSAWIGIHLGLNHIPMVSEEVWGRMRN